MLSKGVDRPRDYTGTGIGTGTRGGHGTFLWWWTKADQRGVARHAALLYTNGKTLEMEGGKHIGVEDDMATVTLILRGSTWDIQSYTLGR